MCWKIYLGNNDLKAFVVSKIKLEEQVVGKV